MIEYPIILASTSLRRKELLQQIGVKFEIVPSQASEDIEKELSPREVVRVLAQRKADAIASVRPEALVIAADTVISLDDASKPKWSYSSGC
ncbi:dTTP/UTP pyrophosphatase [subsurface metagenome]